MSLRPLIFRLMLCLSFVLASSYVQAISHVDDMRSAVHADAEKAKLPPCHQAMKGGKSDQGGQHHGCCSDFACAVGMIVESQIKLPSYAGPVHDLDCGTSGRSGISTLRPSPSDPHCFTRQAASRGYP